MKDRIKSIKEYPLLILTVLFILFFFACFLLLPEKEKSEWENRFLAKKPEVTMVALSDGSYMRSFEDYTNDQLAFRDYFIKIKAVSEAVLLKNVNNGIARGKNGYLFTENLEGTGRFDKNKGIIGEFLNSDLLQNRNVTVAIAPNACEILNSYVPKGMPVNDQALKIDELYSELSLLDNVRVVNLVETLKSHGEEYVYYRTDHHWTSLGAYLAYTAISLNPIELDSLNLSQVDNFYGTLYAKYKGLFVTSDQIDYYDIPIVSADFGEITADTLYDLSKKDVFDKYGMFLYGNYGKSVIKARENEEKELIVFKDSYANSLIPFMTYDYDKITLIDLRYFNGSCQELIQEQKNADILFLYNFDFLNEDNHFYKLMK